MSSRASQVLRVLTDAAAATDQRPTGLSIPTEWFRWLAVNSARLFESYAPWGDAPGTRYEAYTHSPERSEAKRRYANVEGAFAERLAAVDQLRPEQRSLRVGWLFVAGRITTEDGRPRRVFLPLVTIPVRVERPAIFGGARLVPAGDVDITELVRDVDTRNRLESEIEIGGGALEGTDAVAIPAGLLARLDSLQRFARSAAGATGLAATEVVPAGQSPDQLMKGDGLVVVAGAGVYAVHETETTSRAGSLRAWAAAPLDGRTAFHAVYLDPPDFTTAPAGPIGSLDGTIESGLELTPAQRDAVARSRNAPVTLLSGAPGTGKSHAVAAIACDALARGESVLVAAKAEASVDALLDLLERTPGPDPVVFGSNERRDALAARLAAGQLQPLDDGAVRAASEALDRARAAYRASRDAVVERLGAEALVAGQPGDDDTRARVAAPRLFDPTVDLAEAGRRLDAAARPGRGWWTRWRQRRRWRAACAHSGCAEDRSVADLADALRVARAARVAADLVARGGTDLTAQWAQLGRLDLELRHAVAHHSATDSRSTGRLNRSTLPAVAALATALRSGRAARRNQLARIDEKLTRALPLWVGTLPDIDDLLPAISGLFDLVILDEASSIDQPLAAPALLRGRRAVIVGDPRQLRHVSFLSDQQMQVALADNGVAEDAVLAARLDVRRNSAFDVAAAVAPVIVLDEHFRSDPHLVDFVAARLYEGQVKVATRSPATHSKDCVRVVRLTGTRDRSGVIRAEVEWAIAEVARLRAEGATSVGIVTPFRAQADALEAAVLESFRVDDLEALDLRVGTVHAFQGNEKDVIIASLGIGPEEGASSWRFAEDPHLFAVFVTRAREFLTMVVSAVPPAGGLVADYLAQADAPPEPPRSERAPTAWAAAVADDLGAGGLSVITSYPTGRHRLDVCVDRADHPVAVECGVHPDGPGAHVERHLALRRAGWELLDAYPSRWSTRRGELCVELLHAVTGPTAEV